MAGLAHYLALDSIQVPLDLKRHETLAIVGVLLFCVAQWSSHELALSRQLLANRRVREIKPGYVHLGLCNAGAQRG